jgi:hypothetical protein
MNSNALRIVEDDETRMPPVCPEQEATDTHFVINQNDPANISSPRTSFVARLLGRHFIIIPTIVAFIVFLVTFIAAIGFVMTQTGTKVTHRTWPLSDKVEPVMTPVKTFALVSPIFTSFISFVVVGSVCLICRSNVRQDQKRREEEKNRLEEERQLQIAEEQAQKQAETARRIAIEDRARKAWSSIIDTVNADCFIVDSNMWMNEKYDNLFFCFQQALEQTKRQLIVTRSQFDEVCNLKMATEFGSSRNARARMAINRIEKLQKHGLLKIDRIAADAKRDAYADPDLVKFIVAEAKQGKSIRFLTDDKELRIRVREFLKACPSSKWEIPEPDRIVASCDSLLKAKEFGLDYKASPPVISAA